jgi:O-antigen/teichoic acid export membrane protein
MLFLIVGASVAVGFPAGIFGGILEGLGRFYAVNITNLAATLVRAALIVSALLHGYGVLMLAAITVAIPFLASMVRAAIVLHVLPLRFGLKYLSRSSLRNVVQYSSVSMLLMVAHKLRFKTDELILSTLISVSAVTFFSIGDRLVDYTIEVVTDLAQIFVPMSGASDAKGDIGQLRKIFLIGNRACALVVLPIATTLIFLGKSVISLWVGPKYVTAAYPVMLILLIPTTFSLAQSASIRILYGIARHQSFAWVTTLEAIVNLALSLVLIRPFGIIGDAMGTAIPLCCTSLFFLPRHLCRVLQVQLRMFLKEAYLLPILLVLPMVATLIILRQWFVPRNYLQLGFQMLLSLFPYGLGLFWGMRTGRIWRVGQSNDDLRLRPSNNVLLPTYDEES